MLGSLALFLYGMKVMSDSLMELAGDRMRNILATMTSNRVFAVFTGFTITAVIQSSSATTLMVVSFVNASLLTLSEAIGVILGANIGTTLTAWLITILGFKVSMSTAALPLVGLGFLMSFSKKINTKKSGRFIIGFAILFIGLQFLKDAVPDINQNPQILDFLKSYTDLGIWSVLLFLFIGTVLTLIIQSSSATMALTLIMCHEGWLPFDMAAAMVLGENIGTTITANLAALVANFNAKRAARAHFLTQVIGVVIMVIILYPFLRGIDYFLMNAGAQSAFVHAAAIPVALSVFHTSFNTMNMFVLIWFVPQIEKLVCRMVSETPVIEPDISQPKYLNDDALSYPQTAIHALWNETRRLFEGASFEIIAHALNLHRKDIKSDIKLKELVKSSREDMGVNVDELYYTKVKSIYGHIVNFATQIQTKFNLSEEKMDGINKLKIANRKMVEAIKDSKGLQKNGSVYINSKQEGIINEYDRLRRKVSKILREIYRTSKDEHPDHHYIKLEEMKHKVKKNDVLVDGSLEQLFMDEKVSNELISSLANDSDAIAKISKNLINIAELLYIKSDSLLEDEVEEEEEEDTDSSITTE